MYLFMWARWKATGTPTTSGFIIREPWMSVKSFTVIRSVSVEIFQSDTFKNVFYRSWNNNATGLSWYKRCKAALQIQTFLFWAALFETGDGWNNRPGSELVFKLISSLTDAAAGKAHSFYFCLLHQRLIRWTVRWHVNGALRRRRERRSTQRRTLQHKETALVSGMPGVVIVWLSKAGEPLWPWVERAALIAHTK